MKIGVLALQGDFAEHITVLKNLGVDALEVRLPEQLEGLNGLIIPGGESTTIGKLAVDFKLAVGEQKTVRFLLAWYAPEWKGGGAPQSAGPGFTHMYAARFANAVGDEADGRRPAENQSAGAS